jgi:hypothetical protein
MPWLSRWWRTQPASRQDRFAVLAPLAAVLLFLAAIVSAFTYLRIEEQERELEAVKRDVEYAQQRVRLRLLERQEQLMRIARDISNKEVDAEEFMGRAESLVVQYPELQALAWIDERRRVKAAYNTPAMSFQPRLAGEVLRVGETEAMFSLARDLLQPVYSQPIAGGPNGVVSTARAPGGQGALWRRDPGRIRHRQPAALCRADRGLGQVRRGLARWQRADAGGHCGRGA